MMPNVSRRRLWVVYRAPVSNDPVGRPSVCSEREWDALTAARPGVYALVRDGIASEGEAERFARGTAGDRRVGPAKPPRRPEASRVPLYRGRTSWTKRPSPG
jgi:hypothetical protein